MRYSLLLKHTGLSLLFICHLFYILHFAFQSADMIIHFPLINAALSKTTNYPFCPFSFLILFGMTVRLAKKLIFHFLFLGSSVTQF